MRPRRLFGWEVSHAGDGANRTQRLPPQRSRLARAPREGLASMSGVTETTWPKVLPPVTPEQAAIFDDFMRTWHEVLPNRYGVIDRFNHSFPVRHSKPFRRTLEIGAGLGEHLNYEQLSEAQEHEYYALELRENMAEGIRAKHPRINAIVGDCQRRLEFDDGYFDRILAIHVLEHLPNLPACVREMRRLMSSDGQLLVVIPCEGGPAYGFARLISSKRMFEKKYGIPYSTFISREHINLPDEIIGELERQFYIGSKRFFPFSVIRSVSVNLCIGLALVPRPSGA
jgi:SAM-dependent methyltransferase